MSSEIIKRSTDIVLSGIGLLILSPIMLIVAFEIRKTLGSPVLFTQTRAGLRGELFNAHKFRSMLDSTNPSGEPLPDDQRLTPFGLKLRSTSLDELPTLWDVFRGKMSLVGPRPLLPEYLPLYSPSQGRRHECKPGITGWAQINGRNAISWEQRFELDTWYVDNRSFWIDCKILFATVMKVFKREGIQHEGEATMTRFTGTPPDNSC
jgi:lipopolysaccharide/colanic/teichoic acid biosynthesis glycosyltransferase